RTEEAAGRRGGRSGAAWSKTSGPTLQDGVDQAIRQVRSEGGPPDNEVAANRFPEGPHEDKHAQVEGAGGEAAVPDTFLHHARDEGDHVFVVAGKVRLGSRAGRVVDEAEKEPHQLAVLAGVLEIDAGDSLESLPRRARGLDLSHEPLPEILEGSLDDRVVDAFLAPVEVVERGFGDLGRLADFTDGGGVVALLREQAQCFVQDTVVTTNFGRRHP